MLAHGLRRLGIELDAYGQDRLGAYLQLLEQWNRRFNLTAVPRERWVSHHLLDSLSVLPFVRGPTVADLGSGAGLPGVPLAVAAPHLSFTLIDANGKKTRFLNHVKTTLGLENLEIVRARVEEYQPERKFDTLLARAFAEISALLETGGHLCRRAGRILAMKGKPPQAELETLAEAWQAERVVPLSVPGLHADRHVVILTSAG